MIQANTHFAAIIQQLESADKILLLSHIRPDGDAIGSVLALGLVLERLGKEVVMANQDSIPESLRFLKGLDRYQQGVRDVKKIDLVVALDTANRERLGTDCLAEIPGNVPLINIDHHISNELYGDYYYVDGDAPAAGQIVYELVQEAGWEMTAEARDAIYVALSTDTGSFRYPATNARTYQIASELVEAGLVVGDLNHELYSQYSLRRVEVLRALLGTLELHCDGKIAIWSLPQGQKDRIGVEDGDTDGLIDTIRSIRGVIISIFIEDLPDQKVRVSMRSSNDQVNVSEICQHFGGGGHRLASGVRMSAPISQAIEILLPRCTQSLCL